MKDVTIKEVATILAGRGYYNHIPRAMTVGLIQASAKFIDSVTPGLAAELNNQKRLRGAVLQTHLKLLGFDPGKIDGYLGPVSNEAYANYIRSMKSEPPDYFRDEEPLIKNTWPLEKDVEQFYGAKGQNQAKVACPYPLFLAWDTGVKVKEITIHEKVADSLTRILEAIYKTYGEEKIRTYNLDLFGGSLNVRLKRGSKSQWSMHSWGIAIDWDPAMNQLRWGRDRARLARDEYKDFWSIWEEEGWVSLGRTKNYDWMHVQAARPG